MEEILASIRRIISEDTHDAPAPEPEILELTQEMPQEHAAPPPPPALADEANGSHVTAEVQASVAAEPADTAQGSVPAELLAQSEPVESNVVSISHEEFTVSSPAIQDNGIFSEKARRAIDDAFAGLDQIAETPKLQASRGPAMPAVEGNSIEAVFERAVRTCVDPVLAQWMSNNQDALMNAVKPMLRDWMDEHFPALLEGAVREEVARVVKARGGR